ncbi:MAG: nitrilase family protein [Flavobacteriaceae bacterium]|jgi:predicted amidohydrolase|nr:nitrilase family protein [Flavobacteriaceae bacterium]
MKNKLQIQIVEYSPEWENAEANLNFLSQLLADTKADITVLPEMFNTGFSMNAEKISENMDGQSVSWLKNFSLKNGKAVCGSLPIKENGRYYNRFIFIADGKILTQYDKRHLFSLSRESDIYTCGNQRITFEYLGWKILPSICFDLRFPVWMRNTDDYDLIICPASWPRSRIEVWDTLLKARAIENQCFICAVNCIGTDGANIEYNGHSCILSPAGKPFGLQKTRDFLYSQTINYDELMSFRGKYEFLKERDNFRFI